MGRNKLDRTGEERYNNFGSKMIITRHGRYSDIDVYFPEYNWIAKNVQYIQFQRGNITCPYERRTCGVGYLGEGKYKVRENGKNTKCYEVWHSMLQRCYDPKLHKRASTYINCEVCNEWLNHQNFGNWFTDNYYEIDGESMCLDKDILHKGNKIYSPENCVFVPHNINVLFIKRDKLRGECPVGVYYHKPSEKFKAQCSVYDFEENKTKRIHLGYYDTIEKAFEVYKQFKENNIKQVADYYKNLIPNKLYQAMYDYQVDIND